MCVVLYLSGYFEENEMKCIMDVFHFFILSHDNDQLIDTIYIHETANFILLKISQWYQLLYFIGHHQRFNRMWQSYKLTTKFSFPLLFCDFLLTGEKFQLGYIVHIVAFIVNEMRPSFHENIQIISMVWLKRVVSVI